MCYCDNSVRLPRLNGICNASANHDVDAEVDLERAQTTVSNARSDVELSSLSTAPTLSEEPGLMDTTPRTQDGLDVATADDIRH